MKRGVPTLIRRGRSDSAERLAESSGEVSMTGNLKSALRLLGGVRADSSQPSLEVTILRSSICTVSVTQLHS